MVVFDQGGWKVVGFYLVGWQVLRVLLWHRAFFGDMQALQSVNIDLYNK